MEKVKQIISDYVNHLASDERQVIPDDGNVHSITTQSINFLKSLAKNNKIINYVYNGQSPHDVTYLKSLLGLFISTINIEDIICSKKKHCLHLKFLFVTSLHSIPIKI